MNSHDAAARMVLAGSEHTALSNAHDLGRASADGTAEVTVLVRSRMSDAEMEQRLNAEESKPISERHYLSREELAEMRGASSEDIARIQSFAEQYHLEVVHVDAASRSVALKGKIADLEAAFGVELHTYEANGTVFRDHAGAVTLPSDVGSLVRGVLGLSTRPVAHPR
jgi:kumamolisin